MRRAVLALALLVAACAPGGAGEIDAVSDAGEPEAAGDAGAACPAGEPIAVERDAIGGLSFDLTLDELRARCPGARDTTWGHYERSFPGLHLPIAGLTVLALQDRTVSDEESGFDVPDDPAPGAPPDLWVVSGEGGVLPGGVASDAPWRELRAAYGEARVSDEISVTAAFCTLPGWSFFFPDEAFRSGDIDPQARPERIMISFQEFVRRADAAACAAP